MIYSTTTIPYYIELLCRDFCRKTAVIWKTKYRTERISFKNMLEYSQKAAVYFLKQNLKKMDRIFIMGPNCPHWIVSFLGSQLAGMTLIPADFNSSKEFIEKVIKESNPQLFIISRPLLSKIRGIIKQENIIIMEDLFARIESCSPDELKNYNFYITESDIAEIIFTSGTTDQPKGVVLTHKNIGSNIFSASRRIAVSSETKLLSILPLSHMFEQIAGFFAPLRQGGQIIYLQSMKPGNVKNAIMNEKVMAMAVVPAFLDTFKNLIRMQAEKINKLKFFDKAVVRSQKLPLFLRRLLFRKIINELGGRIKFVVSGGCKLNLETEQFWNSLGIRVLQGYGLTETSPVISTTSLNEMKAGSVGKVLEWQFIKLAGDGEILTCGENVFHGYLNNEKLNETIFENGWFKTGDIGEIDNEGYLFIKGRKKNMIALPSGLNVYPEDIEAVINRQQYVKDSVLLAVTEPKFYLYAYVTSDRLLKEKEINAILSTVNSTLADHQRLKTILLWPESDFPRTASRKIIRREVEKKVKSIDLSKKLENSELKERIESGGWMQICTILSELSEIPVDKISKETNLINDLGLDSITRLELLTKLEAEFYIDLNEEEFNKISKAGEIHDFLEKSRSSKIPFDENTISDARFSFLFKIFQIIAFRLFKILSFFIFRVRAGNSRAVRNLNKPVFFIANHSSHLDAVSILRALPSYIRARTHTAAAHDYFFKNNGNIILTFLLNIFPFYRSRMMRTNLLNIGKILDKNQNILIFPEGTRSRDGKINPFKDGIGMIIKAMDVHCIPVKIENSFKLMPYGRIIPGQGTVTVKFGDLMRFSQDEENSDIAKKLYEIIKEM